MVFVPLPQQIPNSVLLNCYISIFCAEKTVP